MQLCGKVTDLLSRFGETPELSQEEFCLCRKAIKKNVWQMSKSSPHLQGYSVLDSGHLTVQVLKRRCVMGKRTVSPQGAWDHIEDEKLLEFAESGHPIFRATTPLSRDTLKSKGHGNLSIHFTADELTIETIVRIKISANQLSLYGAVANVCEEFEVHQDRSGEPNVWMGQSIVLSEIKAEVPLQNENPSHHQILWQQCEERIKSLSQECKMTEFCLEKRIFTCC